MLSTSAGPDGSNTAGCKKMSSRNARQQTRCGRGAATATLTNRDNSENASPSTSAHPTGLRAVRDKGKSSGSTKTAE